MSGLVQRTILSSPAPRRLGGDPPEPNVWMVILGSLLPFGLGWAVGVFCGSAFLR